MILEKEVRYLGHKISESGIRPDSRKIDAVRLIDIPGNVGQLRSFLGMASYLRRFVPNYASLTVPLIALTKKKVKFNWNQEANQAFNAIKEAIAKAGELYPIDPSSTDFVLQTDASDIGVGAILFQVQSMRGEVPIDMASMKFSEVQERWDTRDKELFAIKWAINRWKHLLTFPEFMVKLIIRVCITSMD